MSQFPRIGLSLAAKALMTHAAAIGSICHSGLVNRLQLQGACKINRMATFCFAECQTALK
jgi:hypothetical protein